MITVAKMTSGRIVEIIRVADHVHFAPGAHVMICMDWQQPEFKKSQFKWVPVATRFEWVRSFIG
jgi:hypothetical protein